MTIAFLLRLRVLGRFNLTHMCVPTVSLTNIIIFDFEKNIQLATAAIDVSGSKLLY